MINITFIQYGGMTYRTVKNLAIKLDKSKFNVNYMWCKPGIDLYSSFTHPVPLDKEVDLQTKELTNAGVNVLEFIVNERFIPDPNLPWRGTNFWKIYNSIDTDVVFTWRSGRQEYPFCHISEPVVEWNVFGGYDKSINIVKSLAISPWCQEDFIKNGGKKEDSEVVFLPLSPPSTTKNLRNELNIDNDTIVCGMHQRVEDAIFDKHSLNAIKFAMQNSNKKIDFIFLGGSKKYKEYASFLGIKGHFLKSSMDYNFISEFLNTLNIYTHSRRDGETLGAAIQEAMIHSLPVVSHTSQWNAHIDTIGPGGVVLDSQSEYSETLLQWIENFDAAKEIGEKGCDFANGRYSWERVLLQVEKVFEDVYKNKSKLILDWKPLPLSIYQKRKPYYTARYVLLNLALKFLVRFFGQKSTRFLVDLKRFSKKIYK
jgi:glycosyltransferase involved in cell wall biosynthesis